jgi:Holliday junction resolvase
MNGGDSERELRAILRGDVETLDKITANMPPDMRERYKRIAGRPFIVARAAGSFGMDIVAIRNDFSFPIEVKSSSEPVIRLSRSQRIKEQAEWMLRECAKAKILPIYAYRLKRVRNGDPWRIFTMPVECAVEGRSRLLYSLLPKLETTAQGNLKLEWESGMPLHKFIEYLCPSQSMADDRLPPTQ